MLGDVEALLGPLAAGERGASLALIGDLAASMPASEVVTEWLRPAQLEIGNRWARNALSVEGVHRATSITDAALDLLLDASPPPKPHGSLPLACAPQEWHVLPARMISALLGWRGWKCEFLGAATKADRLDQRVDRQPAPTAVAISCTLPTHLPAVRTLVETAHARGVPVLLGGAAITANRAAAVGADGAANTVDAAVELLDRWRGSVLRLQAPLPLPPQWLEFEAMRPQLARQCAALLAEWLPRSDHADVGYGVREASTFALALLGTAMVVDDEALFAERLSWMGEVIEAKLGLVAIRQTMVSALLSVLPSSFPQARRVVDTAG